MQQAMFVMAVGFVGVLGACDGARPYPPSAPSNSVGLVATLEQVGEIPAAPLGATLSPGPEVIVADGKGRRVPNVVVRFAVRTGDGSITGAETRTDADGRARLASWTLGPVAGVQLLEATAGFRATTVRAEAANPCPVDAAATLPLNVPVSGALEVSDCTQGERFADLFQLTAERQVTVRLVTSATDLEVEGGGPFAWAERVIMPPGTHSIVLLGRHGQHKGPYVIEAREDSESLDGCAYVFALPGITTTQSLGPTDCDFYGPGNFVDQLSIYIKVGQKVTITMSSDVLEPALELWDSDLVVITNGTKDDARSTTLVWTAAYTGEHVLIARNTTPGAGGAYRLSIQ